MSILDDPAIKTSTTKDRFGWTAEQYRNALDQLEAAVGELGLDDLVRGWGEPRHRPEIGIKLPTNAGTVYRIHDAYAEANRIMNRNGNKSD